MKGRQFHAHLIHLVNATDGFKYCDNYKKLK